MRTPSGLFLLSFYTRTLVTTAEYQSRPESGQIAGSNSVQDSGMGGDTWALSGLEGRTGAPLVPFCCSKHHYFDVLTRSCIHSGRDLEISVHTMYADQLLPSVNASYDEIIGFVACPSYPIPSSQFRVLDDGQLLIQRLGGDLSLGDPSSGIEVNSSRYCLIWMVNQNRSLGFNALVCFPEEDEETSSVHSTLRQYVIPSLMTASALFLLATFVVYGLVREVRDLLGKSLMCSVGCLFWSKVCIVVVLFFSRRLSHGACVFLALSMHLTFLQASSWLNVISFFVLMSCFQGKLNRECHKKWFGLSCVYAFGVPMIIAALLLVHDFTSVLDNHSVPKPGFGVTNCGFSNRGAQAVYFYIPISALLGANIVFFCASAWRLLRLSSQTSVHVFQFTLYLKLFFLMGIPWVFEVLSFFFGKSDEVTAASYVWLAFDIFNSLQGIIIFLVFACRKTVLARLSESLCGTSYAKKKYPQLFLQHATEDGIDSATQSLRMTETREKVDQEESN